MLLPSANPLKCHEEVLYLQPTIPPKRFDIFPPDWGAGCSEGLGAFSFFFKLYSMILYCTNFSRLLIDVSVKKLDLGYNIGLYSR